MSAALLVLVSAATGAILVAWSVARLLRARKLHQRGLNLRAENQRLRDDPRFTEIWVKQFKPDPAPKPDDPSST